MKLTGGCYCGALRYEVEGEPMMRIQCHCRECQHITGGMANVSIGMPADGFQYVKGTPKQFQRSDLEEPVRRDCLLYTSPSPRDRQKSRMPSSA